MVDRAGGGWDVPDGFRAWGGTPSETYIWNGLALSRCMGSIVTDEHLSHDVVVLLIDIYARDLAYWLN